MKLATNPLTFRRRNVLILIAVLALILPAVILLRATRAQNRPSGSGKPPVSTTKPPVPTRPTAKPQAPALEPISSKAVGFALSRPVREVSRQRSTAVKKDAEVEEEDREAAENPVIRRVTPEAQARANRAIEEGVPIDGALQTKLPSLSMPAPITTFEGLGRTENIAAGFGSLSPPDTNGSVGPNHYVQQTNLLVRAWNKAGTPLTAPFKLSTLFTPLGGTCAASDKGDPVVLYDELADRWMLSQFGYVSDSAPPFFQCIAISQTNDPTGAYYLYAFQTPGSEFPDYPHLGVWPDGYYMMDHQFTEPGDIFNGTGVFAFDRVKMLAGDPSATYIYFGLNLATHPEAIGGMLPSDFDGLTPPPAGRPNTFVYFTTTDFSDPANGLRLFDFHADFATPANSTFTERAESSYAAPLAVAPFSVVNPATAFTRAAIPQPAPATSASGLDTIADRLMHRMQYRNRGGFETLVMTHTVGAPASTTFGTYRAAPRYYELRSTAGGPFAVQEQATYAPVDGTSRWMGSAAEDNQGNLAVGFSVSSTTVFPGISYAGRLASDPPGGLAQGEATLIAGTGVQTSTGGRWGDYSALTVDPSDGCTFWFTTEYYTAAGQAASAVGWQTRIGSFKFATCTAPAKGTAHFAVTNCTSAANIANAVVSIDGLTYGVTSTGGTYDAVLAPGSHNYSITKFGASVATGSFNIVDATTTNVSACLGSGTAHFVVTDCTSAAAISGAGISIDGSPAGSTNAGGTLDVALPPGSHAYNISKVGYAPTLNNVNITDGSTTNVPACLAGVPLMVANGAGIVSDTNANGAIDPGETVTVSFGVKNNGAGATSSLVGTLQATGGVTSPVAPANYGVVAANGGTGTQSISFTADAGLSCGATLTATLHLQDGASNLGDVTYGFTLCPIVVVTATAGTPGPTSYPTLKAAFDSINAGTHQGAITVSINSSTTEGSTPATLNGSGAGSASYSSVLIRPVADGLSVSGNPAGGFGVIQLNGASNVTIDGDNPNTADTNRNLTIQNTASNTTTFNSVVRIVLATTGATAANNDIIKNLNVLGSATGRNISGASSTTGSENTTYGILAGAGSAGVTAAPAAVTSVSTTIGSPATATNLLIQNNSISTAGRAVAVQGAATTVFAGLQIKDNVIGNPTTLATSQVYSSNIIVNGTADGIISGNTLHLEGFLASSTSGANQAISVGVLSVNTNGVTVEKNKVVRVHNNATDTWPAIGINLGGGINHVVQNNFVSDIRNNMVAGAGGGGTTFGAYGIRVASGTGHKVYHNSVHLFGTLLGASSTNLTAAFMIVNTGQTGMDVRNNLFSNEQTGGNPTTTNTRHTVIYLPSGATSAMNLTLNNNAYLQGPSGTGALSLLAKVGTAAGTGQFFAADFNAAITTPATNLRSYTSTLSAAGTNDNASSAIVLSPPFASNTDLHITNGTTSPLESGGAAIGVTTDIDNQTRPGPPGSVNGGATAPDIGADEFDGIIGAFPMPSPTPTPSPSPSPTPGPCNPVTEGFDSVATLTSTGGWTVVNNSTTTGTDTWFQGNPTVFPAQAGATTDSYIGVNFRSTTLTNDISNWLIMPTMTLRDGNTMSFWTRTTDVGANLFPDRLQVRMSLNSTSTNVGATAASVGDFTTLLLDINPTYVDNYPHNWTKFTVTLSGIGTPTVGRLAFRYFVESGGPDAARSDYIGIDSLEFSCPQPPTIVAATGLSRQQGSPAANSQIATVTGGSGSVVVTATSANPSNGVTISNIVNTAGAITADIAADCTASNASFTLQASDGTSTVTDTLNITVTAPPIPAITPAGPTTFCAGGSVTLTSSIASGNQWYLNGNPIGGATNQTYAATTSGDYTVRVTDGNGCLSAASATTTVTVNPLPATPTITPSGSPAVCDSVLLTSSSASGNQWYLNGNPIGGATNQTYNAIADGSYTVVVTNSGCSSAPSAATNLTIKPGVVTVTNTSDNGAGSFRQAIADVCDSGTINFNLGPVAQTITLTSGELVINKNLTINGPGANLLTISGNNASRVFNVQAGKTVNISGLALGNGNAGGGDGGGVLNFGTLTLTNCALTGNTGSSGGGVTNATGGTLTITGSTISGNAAPQGGGILNAAVLTLINSTISGNTGDGLSNGTGAVANLTNDTFADNSIRGISSNPGSTTNIRNTIVVNTPGAVGDVNGTFNSQGNNLIGKGDGSAGLTNGANNDQVGTIATPLNVLLAALGNYGGPTQSHALLPGSTAIDAGNNCVTDVAHCGDASIPQLTTDQRGLARQVNGTVDIGAFESRGFTIAATSGTPQSTAINTSFAAPLLATVSSAFGEPVEGGQVTFTSPGVGASVTVRPIIATINGSQQASAPATANGIAGGPYNVTAAGNGIGAGANFSLTNTKANQTITFGALASKTFGDLDFVLSPTASSALPVSLAASGNCTVSTPSPGTVQITGAGSCTITASQAGDANYNAAASVPQSFTINKANQTITFGALASKTFGDPDFVLSPTASSALPVSLAASGNCTVSTPSPGTVHITGAGSCTVTASQAGDANYNAAANVPQSFTINKANQTITFGALASKTFGDPDFMVSPAASSALPVSLAASGNCTVSTPSPGTVHITGAGSCTVTASQAGDANYNAAANAPQSFNIAKAATSTAVTSSVNSSDFGQSVTFTATVTSGAGTPTGSVQFKDNGTNLGSTVALNATGVAQFTTSVLTAAIHTITAEYSGDTNVLPSTGTLSGGQAVKAQPSLSINDVSITEGDAGTKVLNFTVTLSAASSLTVTTNYATANGTAAAPSDYAGIAATLLTFNPGDTSKQVSVTINGDVSFEPDETFTLNLSNPVNATISDNQGTGTIQNDDAQGGFSFSQANYGVNENAGFVTVTITRPNGVSQTAQVDYATDDTGATSNCAALNTGRASQRCDYTSFFGTLSFAANETQKTVDIPVNLDAYTEGAETFTVKLSNPTGGAVLAVPSTATVTINDSASPAPNAIDDTTTFVRQQYRDFLNREADAAGLAFWKNNIDKCNDPTQRPPGQTLAACIEVQRIVTSAAFFLSLEFKGTGGLVRDFYVAALDRPATNNMPNFVEFMRDAQGIQKGVVVGQGNWQQMLDANRTIFMNEFVTRGEFVTLYPTTDTPTEYVDKLYQHAKVTGTPQERLDAIADFGEAATAADTGARARALLRVTQSGDFQAREMNRGFVQMQYFGYLRRNPNDAPDNNFNGFNFWVGKLNQFNGDFLQAEMVKAFLSSNEYRGRFGN